MYMLCIAEKRVCANLTFFERQRLQRHALLFIALNAAMHKVFVKKNIASVMLFLSYIASRFLRQAAELKKTKDFNRYKT